MGSWSEVRASARAVQVAVRVRVRVRMRESVRARKCCRSWLGACQWCVRVVRAESACESGVWGLARAEKRRVLTHMVSRDTRLESEVWTGGLRGAWLYMRKQKRAGEQGL